MVNLSEIEDDYLGLDAWFEITFDSGNAVHAQLCEEKLVEACYTNASIHESAGPEAGISLDVALGGGGCEAVVEGFYSLVKLHKKAGGQGDDAIVLKAIVDWSLPRPVSCPKTMEQIGHLYLEGDKKLGLPKHRLPIFFDEKGRADKKYNVSKVVDKLANEQPKCPHIVKADWWMSDDG